MSDLFADSYALVAFLEGNPRYVRLAGKNRLLTSAMNVLEVYAALLRKLPLPEAREIAESLLPLVLDVPREVALSAAEFRHQMRSMKRNCSYVDAWGYAMAQQLKLPFLTGDRAFRGVKGVEFAT